MGYMEFCAPCLFGLEGVLAKELREISAENVRAENGRVLFSGDYNTLARSNICLRTAERVCIVLGSFYAKTFDALFEGTKRLPFERFIGKSNAFPVAGWSLDSKLFSVRDCQKIIKKAAVTRLSEKYHISWFEETGPAVQIRFSILKDRVTVMLDTSGEGLHKRGYRANSAGAPIKETLAAAMVMLSRPYSDSTLYDPFCGSGTIAIEAAMLADGVAPGLHRTFAGESFAFLPADVWRDAREEAQSRRRESGMRIYGSDIDPACVELSRANAQRAGVASRITFACADARAFVSPEPGARGTIVTNPPYGERLGDLASSRKLAEAFGRALRENVPFWQIYVISADEDFARYFGRRPDKVRKLYNGMLRCSYFQFFKKTTVC